MGLQEFMDRTGWVKTVFLTCNQGVGVLGLNPVKGIARTIIVYISSMVVFLLVGIGLMTIRAWTGSVTEIPRGSFDLAAAFVAAIVSQISAPVYFSALIALSYSARRGMGFVASALTIMILATGSIFLLGFSSERVETAMRIVRSSPVENRALGERGLILRYRDFSLAFMEKEGGADSPVVIAAPNESLRIISRSDALSLAARSPRSSPFTSSNTLNPLLESLARELVGSSQRLRLSYEAGWLVLLAHAAAIGLLFASLRPLTGLTRWPFADFILCAIAFRIILMLEGFLSSGIILRFVARWVELLDGPFLFPAALGAMGVIMTSLIVLIRLAGDRASKNG